MLATLKRHVLDEKVNIAACGIERAIRGRAKDLQPTHAMPTA
jgi:hypothetical protein